MRITQIATVGSQVWLNTVIECEVLLDFQSQLASLREDVDELKLENQQLNQENEILKNEVQVMKQRNQFEPITQFIIFIPVSAWYGFNSSDLQFSFQFHTPRRR